MNKILKSKKGITLVALVITIIILLILAGITISSLTGSGLFENAKLAEQEWKEEQEKEEGILGDYTNTISNYTGISNTRDMGSNNFSTEEQVIGTWIDGKTLYQKTFLYDKVLSASSMSMEIDLKNIDMAMINYLGSFVKSSTNQYMPLNYVHGTNATTGSLSFHPRVYSDKIGMAIRVGSDNVNVWTLKAITLIYTKL